MGLIQDLCDRPDRLSRSSSFTAFNGLIYLTAGSLLLAWPGAVQAFRLGPDFVGNESSLVRILGMTVAIIGWFYLFAGRSGSKQLVAASVLDRIILVPLVLIPLAMMGVFPGLLASVAALDLVLGLIAWRLLTIERPGMADRVD